MKRIYYAGLVLAISMLACSFGEGGQADEGVEDSPPRLGTSQEEEADPEADESLSEEPVDVPTLPDVEAGDCGAGVGPGLNLAKCELVDQNLTGSNFSGANLAQANLSLSNLTETDFSDADLSGAIINGSNMTNADFSNANLLRATINNSNMNNVNLSNANLAGSNLSETAFIGANFTSADLTNADLSASNLIEVDFTGAITVGVDFSGSNMMGATITPEQLDQALSVKDSILPDGSVGE